MRDVFAALLVAALLLPSTPSTVLAQGTSSSISGVVLDAAGGAIPGATVVVTSDATGTKFEAVTNGTGAFNVPALPVGTYTVTVSLAGFQDRRHHRRAGAARHPDHRQGDARGRRRSRKPSRSRAPAPS